MKKTLKKLLLIQLILLLFTLRTLAALPERLTPAGGTVGIRLEADGLVVAGFDEEVTAARDAGLKKGDVLHKVNGEPVGDCKSFRETVAKGGPLLLEFTRKGDTMTARVEPALWEDAYKIGLLLRDSMSGIGTVTFYDEDTGLYGALGHGVNEPRSMLLLPLEDGEIVTSRVVEVRRGTGGEPGILKGAFDADVPLGSVEANTPHGIFGYSDDPLSGREPLPVAREAEIHTGPATILANVSGEAVEEFAVEITRLFPASQASGRNLLLTITDQNLLQTTGGIVQGMSGSPILQDGKIVGAVTHVLVDNPTMGYGIFIENMLECCPEYREAA